MTTGHCSNHIPHDKLTRKVNREKELWGKIKSQSKGNKKACPHQLPTTAPGGQRQKDPITRHKKLWGGIGGELDHKAASSSHSAHVASALPRWPSA